jgi:hypothetical protein
VSSFGILNDDGHDGRSPSRHPPVTESNGFGRTSFIGLIFDGILVPNVREADQNEMPEVLSRS